MVKLNAPCLSLGASGKLGDAIVFASWKGRPYARQLVYPANPRSGGQVGLRAMMKFLSQNWTNLSDGEKADWESRAEDMIVSPFNAFVSYNQTRWRNFLTPSIADPATEDDGEGSMANFTATVGVRQVTLSWDVSALAENWGAILYRTTTDSFTPAFSNCIAAVYCSAAETFTHVDSPLDPGTYYYQCHLFSEAGCAGGFGPDQEAVVS